VRTSGVASSVLMSVLLLIGIGFVIFGGLTLFGPLIPFGAIGMFVAGVVLMAIAAAFGYSVLKCHR
jgi:hypothetical protein